VRASLLKAFSILLACCVLGRAARAQDAPAFDPQSLAPVLEQAALIVRGHPLSSAVDPASKDEPRRYVWFEITEILKGTAPGREIQIRQSAAPEGSDSGGSAESGPDEADLILLLGARDPADGSYAAVSGFSNGGYTVESDQDGDWVLVNGPGIEAGPVSPKDVHRYNLNERIPLDVLRQIASAANPAPQPSATAAASERASASPAATLSASSEPRSPQLAPRPPAAAPERDESDRLPRWMAIAAGLAVIAIAAWILLKRASTSGSR
jgi:hypothetical protein